MKLRNRQTGEIKDWDFGNWYQTILNPENKEKYECNLNDFIDRTVKFREDWEDVPEEPKEYWYIDWTPEIGVYHTRDVASDADERQKEIGNYFETKEEAEKAVEKLKAWKRLKDNGFKFGKWDWNDTQGHYILEQINFVMDEYDGAEADLDLLFGGGE